MVIDEDSNKTNDIILKEDTRSVNLENFLVRMIEEGKVFGIGILEHFIEVHVKVWDLNEKKIHGVSF